MRQILNCKILIFRKLYDETDYDCANVQKEDIVWKSRTFNRKAEQYFLFINGRLEQKTVIEPSQRKRQNSGVTSLVKYYLSSSTWHYVWNCLRSNIRNKRHAYASRIASLAPQGQSAKWIYKSTVTLDWKSFLNSSVRIISAFIFYRPKRTFYSMQAAGNKQLLTTYASDSIA